MYISIAHENPYLYRHFPPAGSSCGSLMTKCISETCGASFTPIRARPECMRRTKMYAAVSNNTAPTATPTPIPAFAPVDTEDGWLAGGVDVVVLIRGSRGLNSTRRNNSRRWDRNPILAQVARPWCREAIVCLSETMPPLCRAAAALPDVVGGDVDYFEDWGIHYSRDKLD